MTAKRLKKIVVGTDLNELATSALRFASGMASIAGAEVIVLYADIFEPQHDFTANEAVNVAQAIERSKRHTREHLERHVSQNIASGVRWQAIVADGLAAPAISMLADTERADLIALGTHGRGGLQRLVIGSVAEAVIREARVPVLTVRSTKNAQAVRRILCPVNASNIAAIAASRAATLAAALGAELALMHVSPPDEQQFDPASLMPESGVKTTILLRRNIQHDDAAAEILDVASEAGYDLIVIGAEHKLVRDVTLFGSTTARITRHSSIPVLTVTPHAVDVEAAISQETAAHVM